MATQDFAREFVVPATPEATWSVVTDVDRLVGWISVLEQAETLEELARYQATLNDRIGMFALRADLDIVVKEKELARRIVAHAQGEDRQIGSEIRVQLELRLEPQDGGTQLAIAGTYEVTGRVATLGSSTIRRKADKILEEFFSNLSEELE